MRQSLRTRAVLALLPALAGCGNAAGSASRSPVPPTAEFVLAAGDSTYWVTSNANGIRVRGAPIDLAQVDGRFVELYVVDHELSFAGADLIGQSVYRRDLQTGDSTLVYTDSLVPALARQYARAHPTDHRLGADEEPDQEPILRAAATLDLGAAHGRFVSFSLHTDVEREGVPLWHTSRRGVIDLSAGRAAMVSDVAGASTADVERRRDSTLQTLQLGRARLDPGSFSIATSAGGPAITYVLPGAGPGDAGQVLALDPIGFAQPAWWRDVASSLPMMSSSGARDVWAHGAYSVVVRYDSTGGARLAIRDSTSREWPVGPVAAPATHIFWLDAPHVDGPARNALLRAFDEAAAYGSDTKVASDQRRTARFVAAFLL